MNNRTIGKVKLLVAVDIHGNGGGCVFKCLEVPDLQAQTDIDEYAGYLDDLFHEGTKPPKDPGVYLFDGVATGVPYSDCMYKYEGEFKPIVVDIEETDDA